MEAIKVMVSIRRIIVQSEVVGLIKQQKKGDYWKFLQTNKTVPGNAILAFLSIEFLIEGLVV